jgi:subtilisin family serine protease
MSYAQSNNSSYYYKGQQILITLSEKIMFVKFISGLTNSQKQSLITQAQVDLQNADWNDIPDLVQLKSKILQHQVWIYPCGPPVSKPVKKDTDSLKMNTPNGVEGCSPPCPPPPGGGCAPYQVWQNYDNFYEALFFFLDNTNVRSGSKAIIRNVTDTIATCEDFFIKIKPGYTINDFSSLISYYSLTSSDVSADFGSGIYKISESRGGSRFCIDRANIFFGSGMCDFSHPNFYEFSPSLTGDPLWGQQWSLLNTGQYNGIVNADIRVVPAWAFTKGSNIKVAVVDEGTQLDHPDLQANILPGYDAILNASGGGPIGIKDKHGTNCAGIIGAIADNNIGISGVAPESKIIPIRAFSDNYGGGSNESIARAINWAWTHGADVISNSYKWDSESDLIDMAIHNASTLGRGGLGSIVIYASGNSGGTPVKYPGRLPEAIAVGNMSMCNQRASPQSCDNKNSYGSSYGVDLDLMAPV